jgi:AcrR family transcriptional regulator
VRASIAFTATVYSEFPCLETKLAKSPPPAARLSKAKPSSARRPSGQRLSPEERERQILEGAVSFFSEVGFSGQTRELSRRLGITQPLLYRYFSSKQALIDRVYDHVFLKRWKPEWVTLIHDQDLPLRERLIEFYRQYATAIYQPEWVRIYIFAGLAGTGLNKRYLSLVERELLNALCMELRSHCGHAEIVAPVAPQETEFVWSLHGGLFYYAVRHCIFGIDFEVDFLANVATVIDNFLAGAKSTYPKLLAEHVAPAKGGRR